MGDDSSNNNDSKRTAGQIDLTVLESLQTIRTDPTGRVDLELLEHRLSLTPGERLDENDRAAAFTMMVREAGERYRAAKQ